MRIVDLEEFLAQPTGTLFAKYTPNLLEELCIKRESLLESNDFTYEALDGIADTEQYIAMEDGYITYAQLGNTERDGCFDLEQLFLIYSTTDVKNFIKRLETCLGA